MHIKKYWWALSSWLLSGLIVFILFCVYLICQVPDVKSLVHEPFQMTTKVYDRSGVLIAELGAVRRSPIEISQAPPRLIQAILAVEDHRFFEHNGVDLKGLMRAAWELLLTGSKNQGGSTITMQVARNFYLSREKTFFRKFREILLAISIDQHLSKEKILELYLNKIYFGNRAYGIASASEAYFDQPLYALSLPQIALLAGLPKAPSLINPIANPKASMARRNHVLKRMFECGFIDQRTYEASIQSKLSIKRAAKIQTQSYLSDMVAQTMIKTLGEKSLEEGLSVYTTFDARLQKEAENELRRGLIQYTQRRIVFRGAEQHIEDRSDFDAVLKKMPAIPHLQPVVIVRMLGDQPVVMGLDHKEFKPNVQNMIWRDRKKPAFRVGDVIRVDERGVLSQRSKVEGALVALNPKTGAMLAMVGGFGSDHFNRAVSAFRQTGSSFKPLMYAAALDRGMTLAQRLNDEPTPFVGADGQVWDPKNDDEYVYGAVTLRYAMIRSLNLASIDLLKRLGLPNVIRYLQDVFDIPKDIIPHNMTLALGTLALSPLEMAKNYSIFANGGWMIEPHFIDRVIDSQGEIRMQYSAPEIPKRLMKASTAFLMNQLLKDVVTRGTGSQVRALGRTDLAGKTGTTNNMVDGWFVGYHPTLVTAVWVGYDQPKNLKEHGAQAALPIWMNFMRKALEQVPHQNDPEPDDIVRLPIDMHTGLRVNRSDAWLEYFAENTIPPMDDR